MQRLVVHALARAPGVRREGVRRRHCLPALNALLKDELVARDASGQHRIAVPLLADWLRRVLSPTG